MSKGSIKPSAGGTSKVTRSAISKVAKSSQESSELREGQATEGSDKLSSLRPGSVFTEKNKNNTDKGEIAKNSKNQAQKFTSEGSADQEALKRGTLVNRVWGKTGVNGGSAQVAAASTGSPSPNSYYSGTGSGSVRGISSPGAFASSSKAGPVSYGTGSSRSGLSSTGGFGGGSSGSRSRSSGPSTVHSAMSYNNNDDINEFIHGQNGGNSNNGSTENLGSNNAQDPYKQVSKLKPDHQPTGTGTALRNYKEMMEGEDKELYQKLEKLVKTYSNNSVSFGTNLSHASKENELTGDNKYRTQAIAAIVDAIKDSEHKDAYIEKLEEVGGMDIFISDELSFAMNKSVGGFVATGEGSRPQMALPQDLTDYTHADIARHEMYHLLDSLADGKLDGMQMGEGKEVQDLLISAIRGFQNGKFDSDKIEKLDVGNLRYGAGYLKTLSDSDAQNDLFAYTEANSVLRQEWADKPEEFRAVGGDFEKLADIFEKSDSKYEDSYVKKDGDEDGTAMS